MKWLNKYQVGGGLYISDRAKATQFGQYIHGGDISIPDLDADKWLMKYLPKAQNGKTLSPIYTDDPRKVKYYQDSLSLHKLGEAELRRFFNGNPSESRGKIRSLQDLNKATKRYSGKVPKNQLYNTDRDALNSNRNVQKISNIYNRTNILPTEFWANEGFLNYRFKKPVQPYILQEKPLFEKTNYKPELINRATSFNPSVVALNMTTSQEPFINTSSFPKGDDWNYVYGPANSVIGRNYKGTFYPENIPEQRGKVNQADLDLLNNEEALRKYVQEKSLKYAIGGSLPKAQNGKNIKKKVEESLSNLPIYAPDVRYPEYQANVEDWKRNLQNVTVEENPNLTNIVGNNTPGSYFERGAFSPSKTYPYQGTVQLNPKYYNPIDTEQRVLGHELTHAAFEGTQMVPQWLGDNLYRTARNPQGFETGPHQDLFNERAAELMGIRREIVDKYKLPLNSKIPREMYDFYLRDYMNTNLRTGKMTESNELRESLYGARNATDLYNLLNMENIPQQKKGGIIKAQEGGWLYKYQIKGEVKKQMPSIFNVDPRYTTGATESTGIQRVDPNILKKVENLKAQQRQTYLNQGRPSDLYQQRERYIKNKTYAAQQPNAAFNEQSGDVSRINPNRSVTGEAENFMSEREDKGREHWMNAIEAAGYLEGAGALGKALGKEALATGRELGEYLTTQTPLKNTYGALRNKLGQSMESGWLSKMRNTKSKLQSPTAGTDYIWNHVNNNIKGALPKGLTKQHIADVIEGNLSWIESPEYLRRRMATTGETAEQVTKDVQALKNRFKNTIIKFTDKELTEGTLGTYTANSSNIFPKLNKDIIVIDPNQTLEEIIGTIDHEVGHALSPALKNENLYKNYPFLPTEEGDAIRESLKQKPQSFINKIIKGDRSKDYVYLEKPVEQQVRYNRLNAKIREDLNLSRNEGTLTDKQFDQWSDTQRKDKFKSFIDSGYEDVGDLLGSRSNTVDRSKILENLNKAWGIVPAVGVGAAGALNQKKKGGVIKDNNGYWNPKNWGKTVQIDSNNITMKPHPITGQPVPVPLLGIGADGEQQMMYPGKDYKFRRGPVTEIPMAQDGGWLSKYQIGGTEYFVKPGDTLSKIARSTGASIRQLTSANNLANPNLIRVNQKLIIPTIGGTQLQQSYQNWDDIRRRQDELNALQDNDMYSGDEQRISQYYTNRPDDSYVVVDKKRARMNVYKGNKLLKSYEVGTGANPGDAQTVTRRINGKTDWQGGNKSTGAGVYTISNIDPKSHEYYGLPAFNLKNDQGIEVATTIHGTPIERRSRFNNNNLLDNRMSNGCINGKCYDLQDLYGKVDVGSKVYILPEDEGNTMQIVDGKPVLRVNPKNRAKYNQYVDQTGTVRKGQGINQSVNTLQYKPIIGYLDKKTFMNDVYQSFDTDDEEEYKKNTKPYFNSLVNNKKKVMQATHIPSDVYNEIAKMSFGIYGTESNFGDENNPINNAVKTLVKVKPISSLFQSIANFKPTVVTDDKVGGPDVRFKASLPGALDSNKSVGFTQIRWSELNKYEKDVLKKLGVSSNKDFLDPEKAAMATTAILAVRYNQQLDSDQKKDMWKHLPTKWNKRANYADRVKRNSKYLTFKQLDSKLKEGGETDWLSKYQFGEQYGEQVMNNIKVRTAPVSDNTRVSLNTRYGRNDLVSPSTTIQGILNAPYAQEPIENSKLAAFKTGFKFLDPTGVTSWGDALESIADAYDNPGFGTILNAGVNTLGALPLVHYLGAGAKLVKETTAAKTAAKLNKFQKAKKYAGKTLHYISGEPVTKFVDKITKASELQSKFNPFLTGVNRSNRFWEGVQGSMDAYSNSKSNKKTGGEIDWLTKYK